MNLIKKKRIEKNLTQEELGNLVELKKAVISHYEKGRAKPSIESAKKIGEALNFPWHQIFEEEE